MTMDRKETRDFPPVIIEARRPFLALDGRELWRYRYLVRLFVRRNFTAVYKQSILGPLWHIISPLLSTLVFTVVFGTIARIPTDGVPPVMFYLSGVVVWSLFSTTFMAVSQCLLQNAHIFSKVYFPRLAVPLADSISKTITFCVQFALFLALYAWFLWQTPGLRPSPLLLAAPLLLFQTLLLAFGLGLLVATFTVKYRDLSYLLVFFMQLWMYATPVVYPLSQVPAQWRFLMYLNPMTPVVEGVRSGFFGSGDSAGLVLWPGILMTVVLAAAGVMAFNRAERTFVDTI